MHAHASTRRAPITIRWTQRAVPADPLVADLFPLSPSASVVPRTPGEKMREPRIIVAREERDTRAVTHTQRGERQGRSRNVQNAQKIAET